ncbi:hypothetical protein BDF14DRAFT_1728679 [Spinellus fusiger]|nr:hypothetical protein BDF14DRAFT_1728679 [Spinellus fusiger]
MANSFLPVSRIADYFFVAGLHDENIIPTYEATKRGQQTSEDIYYDQQKQAAATEPTQPPSSSPSRLSYYQPSTMTPIIEQQVAEDSLCGVLDHVQAVIDTFGKERDSARDVIAVHPSEHIGSQPHSNDTSQPTHATHSMKMTRSGYSLERNSHHPLPEPSVPNLLELKYVPNVLTRYPKKDYSPTEMFPSYVAMAMTDESGKTIYGTCVTFYEPLSSKLYPAVNQAIQEWVQANMTPSTVEYAHHLKGKIEEERRQLESHGAALASLGSLTTTPDIQRQREFFEEQVRTSQENISLYSELLIPVKMGVYDASCVWVPKSIGVLSGMPWPDLLGDWLRILVEAVVGVRGQKKERNSINIESAVYNLIRQVPCPSPGRFETHLTLHHRSLFFSRPAINQVPLLKNTLLAEGKVLFLSKHSSMLSLAAESFRYLLFPFYWQFVFIPVLPEKLLTCLQAPVPYIIGYQGEMEDLDDDLPEDICIVNLDINTVHQSEPPMTLPRRTRRKLQLSLEQYAPMHTHYRVPYGVPFSVQETYPNGRLLLNCGQSRTQEVFVSPAQRRGSESSDGFSLRSYSASVLSKPLSGFWSSNSSIRSSNDSTISLPYGVEIPTPSLPQYPHFAKLDIAPQPSISTSTSSIQSSIASSHRTMPQRRPSQSSRMSVAGHSGIHLSDESMLEDKYNATHPKATDHTHSGIQRLSSFMSKPRAVFQQHTLRDASASAFPRIAVSNDIEGFGHDKSYGAQQMMRRVHYVEGHTMVEMLHHELASFHGHRCLCGQQVEQNGTPHQHASVLMYCQDCCLVTHASCTNEILHPCLPACFDEANIQASFLRMFASLLSHYRSGVIDGRQEHSVNGFSASFVEYSVDKNGVLFFSKEKFLKPSDKDTRLYLSNIANSQMFNQFITDRLAKSSRDPEILFFDEYIKLKLNRSKLKFVKESTPFLNDDSYHISQTIRVSSPDDTRHGHICKLL